MFVAQTELHSQKWHRYLKSNYFPFNLTLNRLDCLDVGNNSQFNGHKKMHMRLNAWVLYWNNQWIYGECCIQYRHWFYEYRSLLHHTARAETFWFFFSFYLFGSSFISITHLFVESVRNNLGHLQFNSLKLFCIFCA